jgi:hypothetical protein
LDDEAAAIPMPERLDRFRSRWKKTVETARARVLALNLHGFVLVVRHLIFEP